MMHDTNKPIHNEGADFSEQQIDIDAEAESDADAAAECHRCIAGPRCDCDYHGGGYSHYHCTICDREMSMSNPDWYDSVWKVSEPTCSSDWN